MFKMDVFFFQVFKTRCKGVKWKYILLLKILELAEEWTLASIGNTLETCYNAVLKGLWVLYFR